MRINKNAFLPVTFLPGEHPEGAPRGLISRPFYGYRFASQYVKVQGKSLVCTIQGYRAPEGRDAINQLTDSSVSVLTHREIKASEWVYPDGSRWIKKATYAFREDPDSTPSDVWTDTTPCWWVDTVRGIALPYLSNGWSHTESAPSHIYYPDYENPDVNPVTRDVLGKFKEVEPTFDREAVRQRIRECLEFGAALYYTSDNKVRQECRTLLPTGSVSLRTKYLSPRQVSPLKQPFLLKDSATAQLEGAAELTPYDLSWQSAAVAGAYTYAYKAVTAKQHQYREAAREQFGRILREPDVQPSPATCAAMFARYNLVSHLNEPNTVETEEAIDSALDALLLLNTHELTDTFTHLVRKDTFNV